MGPGHRPHGRRRRPPVHAQRGDQLGSLRPPRRPGAWGGTDSVGVSLIYDYQYITPLGNLMGLGGAPVLQISDRTIMALNPAAN